MTLTNAAQQQCPDGSCTWCGMHHGGMCPKVKAIEYHENGFVKRVEFYAPVDYPPLKGGPFAATFGGSIG